MTSKQFFFRNEHGGAIGSENDKVKLATLALSAFCVEDYIAHICRNENSKKMGLHPRYFCFVIYMHLCLLVCLCCMQFYDYLDHNNKIENSHFSFFHFSNSQREIIDFMFNSPIFASSIQGNQKYSVKQKISTPKNFARKAKIREN